MQIKYVKINELKPSEYNPRKWDEKMINDLKESISRFGIVDPIIVNEAENRKNIVIGGHFRLYVAKLLGFDTIPCIFVNISDETKERELNLRLNKNLGDWDFKALADLDQDLLSSIGFSSDQLDRIFDLQAKEDDFDIKANIDVNASPRVKFGQIWALGRHRLMCGDSEKAEDVNKLMNEQKARLIFTDPPYNVDYKSPGGLNYASTKFGGTGGKIFNDNKTEKEALIFYTNVLKNLFDFSTDDCSIYWWFANKNNLINRQAFRNAGWKMSQIIIWLKNSMVFSHGQDYHRCYEPCMFGWKQKQSHYKNKAIGNLKDVFNLDKTEFEEILDIWYEHRDVTTDYIHPTQKPVRLAERALRKNSEINDIVLDLFGGSGSTLIACEQMNRNCFISELDPKYCDAIIKRWEEYTGLKAQLL